MHSLSFLASIVSAAFFSSGLAASYAFSLLSSVSFFSSVGLLSVVFFSSSFAAGFSAGFSVSFDGCAVGAGFDGASLESGAISAMFGAKVGFGDGFGGSG